MPTYEYRCESCNHAFEAFHSMMTKPLKVCPVCGKHKLRRLIGGGAGLIFKGSGFYITDYKNKKPGDGKSKSAPVKSGKDDTSKAEPVKDSKTSTSED